MNRFPLLRLPYVALREVIVIIDKSDVLNLALSSRKTCKLVNTTRNPVSMRKQSKEEIDGLDAVDRLNMARLESLENLGDVTKSMKMVVSKKLSLQFDFLYIPGCQTRSLCRLLSFEFRINPIDDLVSEEHRTMRFGDLKVPIIIDSKTTFRTFWKDIEFGFQFLSRHFAQEFKLDDIILDANPEEVDGSKFSRILENAVDVVKSSSEAKPSLSVNKIELFSDVDLQNMFRNIKYEEIRSKGPLNRRLPVDCAFEAKNLVVQNSDGFTLKDLLSSKCSRVHLIGNGMTNKDMKEFLINWTDGNLETLEEFVVELIEEVDMEKVLAGLSDRTGCNINQGETLAGIKRGDGKSASVYSEKKMFTMITY
ncbi:unnamed protein product [Caenorhabditis brenneri]